MTFFTRPREDSPSCMIMFHLESCSFCAFNSATDVHDELAVRGGFDVDGREA